MYRSIARWALWCVVAVVGMAVAGHDVQGAVISNADCMQCHADSTLTRSSPPTTSVFVAASPLAHSVHGRLACQTCHRGIAEIPHAARVRSLSCESCHRTQAAAVRTGAHRGRSCAACHGSAHRVAAPSAFTTTSCGQCHDAVVRTFRSSVHVQRNVLPDSLRACARCHGSTHTLLTHGDASAPTARAKIVDMCATCHGDRQLMLQRKIAIPAAYDLFRQSVHGRSRDPRAAICTDCHTSHDVRRAGDPRATVYRTAIPTTCGQCHAAERRAFDASVHGMAVRRGVVAAPVCTDCHGEHRIRGPKDPDSPVSQEGVTRTCARCHEAQGIRETYGLAAGRLSTYEDSYHGLAARWGSPVVANCASCHGVHDILPSSDPRSRIAPGNLPMTCGKCHPGIGESVAIGRVHVTMATPDQPALFWVRRVYTWLIVGVIGGMLVHNALNFLRCLRDAARTSAASRAEYAGAFVEDAAGEEPDYVRLTTIERVQHWLLMVSFGVLVYTGFALKFPEAWPFAWFARAEHGYAWRSIVHRAAAVVMTALIVLHIAYLFTRRGRETLRAGIPRLRDLFDVVQNVLYFVGARPRPPAFGRFNYIEKAEYWALVWGTIVMTVTGGLLWFENTTLRFFGKWATDLSTIVHYYEAWLAFLAIVVWHLFYTIFHPDVYPMDWTWLTGRFSMNRLRHEKPLEWQRVREDEARRTAAAADSAPSADPGSEPP